MYLSRAFAMILTIFFVFLCFASPKGGWLTTQSSFPSKSAQEREIAGLSLHFGKRNSTKPLSWAVYISSLCCKIHLPFRTNENSVFLLLCSLPHNKYISTSSLLSVLQYFYIVRKNIDVGHFWGVAALTQMPCNDVMTIFRSGCVSLTLSTCRIPDIFWIAQLLPVYHGICVLTIQERSLR